MTPENIKYGKTIYGVVGEYVSPVYTVTFNAYGGIPTPAAQTIAYGGLMTKPTGVTKESVTLTEWSTDAGITAWVFDENPVLKNVTLTAYWNAGPA